ncbi:cilia- and flagella-associated protein 206-like isoform X1 [Hydractinia symbiolongicarpus]|uniref:cilia- and flagella-associated protein 206-like isoform X1 n=2 Tax=Hydractinia symbiolongicarpus TaxID=13093 RepID=UPI00254D49EA|nr:cilia- and flagella-associated protein 206-like isoform X1 [Hydractinia symbiolongicarpus]XP_057307858.1 cilia- and flagella-associated protein 206-like isoform X1 [Hydractinia symbiolongicarpus]
MSRAQAESVIKNIIREIAQECAGKGQVVSETLVAFMVKAVVLDPDNGFNVDRTLTKADVEKLIKTCVFRLLEKDSPSLDTVKMQVYFDMNYTTREDFLEEHRRVLDSRLQPVVREITDSRARTREELEVLYTRIVSCVLLRSGLGSPTDIGVVREATAALQSVFPQTELGTFMSLVKRDKERQLVELALIVTGIRLFNRECGKGGEGVDDIPAVLKEAIPATIQSVADEIKTVVNRAYTYTAVLENACLHQNFPNTLDWAKLKDAHFNTRQHEHFLNVLLYDIKGCAAEVESLEAKFQARMESVRVTVSSKTAVPTAQVYPQFINLAHHWAGFQDEMVLLSVLSNVLSSLDQFADVHNKLFSDEVLSTYLQGVTVKTDMDRMRETNTNENRINPAKILTKTISVLFPQTTTNFEHLPIYGKGFCPWSLATYNGLLIPANPSNGVIEYNEGYYAFSTAETAYEFAADPEYFITGVSDVAKKSPELIQLLELHKQFAAITPYAQGKDKGLIQAHVAKADMGTQTELHPIETNLVDTYEWNEWELRRKALKLANLRTKITHSVQTDQSNYRRDNATQVYLPKEVDTQTKRDNSTNVPKPSVYIAGLRGCGSTRTKMTKVDLTLDVDQS